MTGYVYAIESGGFIKIGFSRNPDKRFSKIASDTPLPCVLLGYWPATIADELAIHDQFHSIRKHGEWFASTETLLGFVADHVVASVRKSRFDINADDSALARWRKGEGRSAEKAAEMAGVTVAMWSRFETGARRIPAERVIEFETLTGVSRHNLRPDVFGEAPKKKRDAAERENA
jgi:hypothetical protein